MDDLLPFLAELVAAHGAERFLDRPLLDGKVVVAAQAWDGTLVALGHMLHAVLDFCGMPRRFELVDAREPFTPAQFLETEQPRVFFISGPGEGGDSDGLVFQVERVGGADPTLGAVCHAVARAFLATAGARHPFRADDEGEEAEGWRVGVAEVYLGLGLVATATAMMVKRASDFRGSRTMTSTATLMVGDLPTAELAELLAAQLAARGRPDETRALLPQLGKGPAEAVQRGLDDVDAAEVRRRLGLPAPADKVVAIEPSPPSEAQLAEWAALDARFAAPNRGKQVRRFYEEHSMIGVVVAVTAAAVVIGLLGRLAWELVAAAPVLGLLVGVLTRRGRRETCGACWIMLAADAETCPRCGGTLMTAVPMSKRRELLEEDESDSEREHGEDGKGDERDEDGKGGKGGKAGERDAGSPDAT